MSATPVVRAVPAVPASVAPSAVVYALQFTAVGVWVAYATIYFRSLGIDLATIGILAAVPSAVAIVGAPAWGLVADRLGDMRPPYLAAALWAAVAALVLALGPAMPWLAVVVVGIALGTSGLTPLLDARTVQRLWPDRERFGQARVWGSISFMVCTVAVGIMIGVTGLRSIWIVYAAALAAAGGAAYLLLGRPSRELRVGGIGPRAALGLLRDPSLGLFFVGSTVAWMSSSGALTLFSLRIVDLGGGTELVGIGWAVSAMFEVPLMLAFRRIAQRVRVERLIVTGLAIFALRTALWAVAASPLVFIVVAALNGIGFALVLVGTTAYVASRVPTSLQATAQALFSSTPFAIGAILGAVIAGQVAAVGGIGAVYPVAAVGATLGAALVWLAIARRSGPAS